MKQPADSPPTPALTVLVHPKIVAFQWGRTTLEALLKCARKQKMNILFIHSWRDALSLPPGSPLVLYGTDEEWLHECLASLRSARLRLILLENSSIHPGTPFSRILFDQRFSIQSSLDLLRGQGRTKTAFLGAQKGDPSDQSKADFFAGCVSGRDVYPMTDGFDGCFQRLLPHLDRYDSIICANDLVAICLMARLRRLGARVPEDIHLIGNGNLYLSSHVVPGVTSLSYSQKEIAAVTIQTAGIMLSSSRINTMDIYMKGELVERASTGADDNPSHPLSAPLTGLIPVQESSVSDLSPELRQVNALNRIFSSCSETDLIILARLTDGTSYQSIASEVFLSADAVKYHIKKLYRHLGIHRRQELIDLTQEYGVRFI